MSEVIEAKREHLANLRVKAEESGGPERVAKQHKEGKYTARERIKKLVDPDTFKLKTLELLQK